MTSEVLPFSCAVVTGGGGGLGKALSSYLISKGKRVILAGRTESNLRETMEEIGATDYFVLDTGRVDQIPSFIAEVTKKHPDLDCLINNAGVQRPLQVLKDQPETFLEKADEEININIRGPMHLTLGLLEHFKNRPGGATIMNVSSLLGFVPFSVINPVYYGTKAWLHFWTMNLRSQLAKGGYDSIKVIEIIPPAVGTDLHRDREDPDDSKKHKNPNALSIEEFMDIVCPRLERGDEVIAPGMSENVVDRWYKAFGETYQRLSAP
ncbi:hypothetical protein ASPZODRAFT_73295 [Penicilliopsis zonata CBS 506.65]|uniref:Uncharacterized protein n=1 Tax=Penicilliopsis zonata CBS 506.65 TaxID=1073090 RepID=A0A1L9S9R0_9EURO|nr:hypothetical protein ASPZODRAFT_73295 [Penicilliopsis zonata CBS 506.65]OJJ43895.1 hypothetical protein ASPZODRAFT_73295 [Penicilliopsis zonata CBS 506.65]